MKKEVVKNSRHEEIVDFLSKYDQYLDDNRKPKLKKIKDSLTVDKIKNIEVADINLAVVAFTDVLNIYSGSASNVDFYRLLQAYIRIPECRDKINSIVNDAILSDKI